MVLKKTNLEYTRESKIDQQQQVIGSNQGRANDEAKKNESKRAGKLTYGI